MTEGAVRTAALAVGSLQHVVAGVATYLLGVRRHPGLLGFVVFGLVLLVPLWAARAHYGR